MPRRAVTIDSRTAGCAPRARTKPRHRATICVTTSALHTSSRAASRYSPVFSAESSIHWTCVVACPRLMRPRRNSSATSAAITSAPTVLTSRATSPKRHTSAMPSAPVPRAAVPKYSHGKPCGTAIAATATAALATAAAAHPRALPRSRAAGGRNQASNAMPPRTADAAPAKADRTSCCCSSGTIAAMPNTNSSTIAICSSAAGARISHADQACSSCISDQARGAARACAASATWSMTSRASVPRWNNSW